MNPEFRAVLRKRLPVAVLVVLLVILAFLCWKIVYGGGIHIPPLVDAIENIAEEAPPPVEEIVEPPPPAQQWLYVQGNNVLFWPVVGGQCKQRSAMMQVHRGEKALFIFDHDGWIEVELNNQSLPHTHGCIHHTLLGPEEP